MIINIDIKLFILIGIISIVFIFIRELFNYLNRKLDKEKQTIKIKDNDNEFWNR